MLTDVALSLQTLLYAIVLRRASGRSQTTARAWSAAFAAVSLAAFAGALTHALHPDSDIDWVRTLRKTAWKAVGITTAVASGLMLTAAIFSAAPRGRRHFYLLPTAVKTVSFAFATWVSGSFLYTILDYVISMAVVLMVQASKWNKSEAAPWLSAGILLSFIAAGLQRSGVVLHANFNHNDLYHLVQIGAFHLLFVGAKREHDRGGSN